MDERQRGGEGGAERRVWRGNYGQDVKINHI